MRIALIAIYLLATSVVSFSQIQQDTAKTLTIREVYAILKAYHPIAKQADILIDKGKKQLRAARGSFDPKIYSTLAEKDFEKKQYYNIAETGVKIPTWYGITLKTAFEDNRGLFLNPEHNVPTEGLGVFGAGITLGKGLLMDERRATLRKAQLYRDASVMERELMLNQLFYDVTVHYWNWFAAYRNTKAYEEAIILSRERYEGTIQSFQLGDLPAIDTLEAFVQLRDIEIDYRTSQSNLIKYRNQLSNYMWTQDGEVVLLTDKIVPYADITDGFEPEVQEVLDNMDTYVSQHPKMKILNYKGSMLLIDKRLKAEKLKPTVNLNYNFITTGYNTGFNNNDFKWGFELGIPLFLRKGRGEFAVAKLKLQENEYSQSFFETQIRNQSIAQVTEVKNLLTQDNQYDQLVEGYATMLIAEETKFSIGESSMFKVNARQLKLLNTQIKANKNFAKLHQSRGKLFKELGVLHLKE